jgi:acetoin utilization deacetylase AcuC-like enzyme
MAVTEEGFAGMAEHLLQLADQYTEGKVAFLLEGGYDLPALRNSVAAVLQVMQQAGPRDIVRPNDDRIEHLIHRIEQVREKYR